MRDASTEVIIKALRVLARDIQSDDGVANLALLEAANCMEKIERERDEARDKVWRLEKQIEGLNNAANERFKEIECVRNERDVARELLEAVKKHG